MGAPVTESKLRLVLVGCGSRGLGYAKIALEHFPEKFELVAGSDPMPERIARLEALVPGGKVATYTKAEALLAEERLGDVAIIATQDAQHRQHAELALECGYDLLLEKPIATTLEDCQAIAAKARETGRRVMVCHVLRFAPFYRKIKAIIDSGRLGRIRGLHATEGVGRWHFAHSYVRGHWCSSAASSPIILAKSCHDLDLIHWLSGQTCQRVMASGTLEVFRREQAPVPEVPAYCAEGCPVEDRCFFHTRSYLDRQKEWFSYVYPGDAHNASESERWEWLKTSNWGRCVYRCDNDVPDQLTAQLRLTASVEASFTLSASAEGRDVDIQGTEARLVGGETLRRATGKDLLLINEASGEEELIGVEQNQAGYAGHMGADYGLVEALATEMRRPPEQLHASIFKALESHRVAFAIEASRLSGEPKRLLDESQGDQAD